MRTSPFLIGLLSALSSSLVASAHAHAGAGVGIVGPVTYQSQALPSPGVPLSEVVFTFALLLLGARFLIKFRQRLHDHHRNLARGVSLIIVLGLGIMAYAMPSHEVSVTPPVSFTFYSLNNSGLSEKSD